MSDLPYVRFYMSDWLAATRGMKAAEIGIYFTLLALMYERQEPLPEDTRRLARQCGCRPQTLSRTIELLVEEGKLYRTDAGLWNKRVSREFVFRREKSDKLSAAAQKRWEKSNENNDESMQKHSKSNANAMPIPEAISQEGATHLTRAREAFPEMPEFLKRSDWPLDWFEQFWGIYENRVGKADARKALDVVRKRGKVSFTVLMEGLGRYIRDKPPDRPWCNPATWIRQERWDDEPVHVSKPNGSEQKSMATIAQEFNDEHKRREGKIDYLAMLDVPDQEH